MITKFKATNYRALRDFEIEFGQLTLLVGPNACGKSTVLDAVGGLVQATFPSAPRSEGPTLELHASATKGIAIDAVSLSATGIDGELEIGTEARWSPKQQEVAGAAKASVRESFVEEVRVRVGNQLRLQPKKAWRTVPLERFATAVRWLRLDARSLAEPSVRRRVGELLDGSGRGLASILRDLRDANDAAFSRVEADVSTVLPWVRKLRFRGVAAGSSTVMDELVVDTANARELSAKDLSEGTLLLIGLLTATHQSEGRVLLLVDDLDRGLHPSAQVDLIDKVIKPVLARNPQLQIIATTHSPYLVDAVEGENVRVLFSTPEGTKARKLSDHPEYARFKGTLRTGEFWSSIGESWVGNEGT